MVQPTGGTHGDYLFASLARRDHAGHGSVKLWSSPEETPPNEHLLVLERCPFNRRSITPEDDLLGVRGDAARLRLKYSVLHLSQIDFAAVVHGAICSGSVCNEQSIRSQYCVPRAGIIIAASHEEFGLAHGNCEELRFFTGLRQSEQIALTVHDCDLAAGKISINKAVVYSRIGAGVMVNAAKRFLVFVVASGYLSSSALAAEGLQESSRPAARK
ncbi:site-specific integrase [Peristeroidobacter soli]|uniref:hypothetical protein n=1 Tax=Peristeroidobacter soli TaxID=2497877 RepID=UPI00101C6B34|nr:hypothetical protein [Peristeroidobacter soli]